MLIKLDKIHIIICFMTIILLCFSFPIQVLFKSPLPSIIPYVFMIICLLLVIMSNNGKLQLKYPIKNNNIGFAVILYYLLINVNSFIQLIIVPISLNSLLTVYIIYCFPILFYLYFYYVSTNRQVSIVIKAIIICGAINSFYYIYDNYYMIVVGEVNLYSQKAYEYAKSRSVSGEAIVLRAWANNRGHGLLERHTVSATWIALGGFAYLSIVPYYAYLKRIIVIVITSVIIILTLNFTSTVGYIITILLFEFQIYQLFNRYIRKINITKSLIVSCMLILLLIVVMSNETFYQYFKNLTLNQIDLALGIRSYEGSNYPLNFAIDLLNYPINMLKYPIGFILGDGFSSDFGVIGKGGDYGLAETLHRLGLPFFIFSIYGMFTLIIKANVSFNHYRKTNNPNGDYLYFSMCSSFFIMFHEVHMSVWHTKSILPILFFNLAIFNRYILKIPTKKN
jgi:hypothetical protein